MKKKPHKLPWELHDPKPETPYCSQSLDLSDQPRQQVEAPMPKPEDPPGGRAEF